MFKTNLFVQLNSSFKKKEKKKEFKIKITKCENGKMFTKYLKYKCYFTVQTGTNQNLDTLCIK